MQVVVCAYSILLREHKISSATFYKWRSRYEGIDLPMITKIKELELENARLKKMYAEERLRNDILKAVLKKVGNPSQRREMAKIISEEKDISIRTACQIFCVRQNML